MSFFSAIIWMACDPISNPRMIYGVAGFHPFGFGVVGAPAGARCRRNLGIIEYQTEGCTTRGRESVDMKRRA
jgi:hypothetical protein